MDSCSKLLSKEVDGLTRRQQLELWRQKTGRTPMKRKSYVHEYWHDQTQSAIQPRVKRSVTTPMATNNENMAPVSQPRGSGAVGTAVPRRESLQQWLAVHGSVLKRPRSYLPTSNQGREKHKRASQQKRQALGSLNHPSWEDDDRALLKQLFQRDIEETVTDLQNGSSEGEREEEGSVGEGSDQLSRQLEMEFDTEREGGSSTADREGGGSTGEAGRRHVLHSSPHSQTTTPGRHKRRSSSHLNSSFVFQSTKICYSVATPEVRRRATKKRHSCAAALGPVAPPQEQQKTVWLTPVRRSTRRSRNWNTPGMELDQTLCVDSPSQLSPSIQGGGKDVEIVPNTALLLSPE